MRVLTGAVGLRRLPSLIGMRDSRLRVWDLRSSRDRSHDPFCGLCERIGGRRQPRFVTELELCASVELCGPIRTAERYYRVPSGRGCGDAQVQSQEAAAARTDVCERAECQVEQRPDSPICHLSCVENTAGQPLRQPYARRPAAMHEKPNTEPTGVGVAVQNEPAVERLGPSDMARRKRYGLKAPSQPRSRGINRGPAQRSGTEVDRQRERCRDEHPFSESRLVR
jgi:hypothetical protein